ncbi:hypothetical protein [uncultured Draconibacterium sp.]|uniref:hypothetical protein n=1 Tax=uncultured Draconibacterium sp. TaxID=1573823 RepID=UPI002AA5E85C|nr:hypothetical protein [uncultured Draconibacterium sp.]
MNISGRWTYNEDFEYGNSEGEVELTQSGNEVSGVFSFTEAVENNYSIRVTEKVKGILSDGKLLLESVEVKALQNGREISYLPNTFETHRITENQIIGSTFDSEDVCGVFVLRRNV